MVSCVYFRVDAGPEIGLGHLTRCLSLSNYLSGLFELKWIVNAGTIEILKTISPDTSDEFILELKPGEDEMVRIIDRCQPGDIVVLDGYQFGPSHVARLKSSKIIVAFIDDVIVEKLNADIVINHCGGINQKDFRTNPLTVFCLGPDYALLRSSFLEGQETTKKYDVLLGFGGADPSDFTRKTLAQLPEGLRIAVLIGPAYKFGFELEEQVAKRNNITIFKNLGPDSLATLMSHSANAVLSASVISYEFLALGSGNLYVLQTAENQSRMFRYLTSVGMARHFEGHLDRTFQSKQIIDGKSGKRFRSVFQSIALENRAFVRRAVKGDAQTVFDWINDTDVRRQSYHTDPIDLETHTRWFGMAVVDVKMYYYLILCDNKPIGQIRFSKEGSSAVINYLVDPDSRGQGWGDRVLRLGIRQLMVDVPEIKIIKGYVKQDNHASFNSFIKCNFTESSTKKYPDSVLFTLHLI